MASILVVDDERMITDLIEMVLDGHTVAAAHDGERAVALARDLVPDLIVMDVNMPKMDGIEACRLLRKDSACRSIPILVLTGRGQMKDVEFALEYLCDDYLVKPFSPEVLRARVADLLKRGSTRGKSPSLGGPVL